MKERRSLIAGLSATPDLKEVESAFVFGNKPKQDTNDDVHPQQEPSNSSFIEPKSADNASAGVLPHMKGRIPVTTRCRPEVASALKRASLQRQLVGVEPFYVQDILEAAIESWLSANGVVVGNPKN